MRGSHFQSCTPPVFLKCLIVLIYFSGNQPAGGKLETILIVSGAILGLLLLLFAANALRKYLKGKISGPIMKEDINDTYGDYYTNPDPVVEMTDSNDYYTGVYEDGTTMTRDNNSQYGY